MLTPIILALTSTLLCPVSPGVTAPVVMSAIDVSGATTDTGTIKSVDKTGKTFVLTVGSGSDAKDITVTVNDKTTYTLDGAASTMDKALAAGHKASVKHSGGVASSVEATTVK